ncbi:hypothetical protein GCM10022419_113010 [Nonomuraea rosea]|uniref:Uncharacterized protein n=1 Tax=Nonomuraea rosea TaxID=638574 RepID=A0ABP6ZHQ3_9ACTN
MDGAQRGLDEAREQADGAARRLLALDVVLARRKAEPETNETRRRVLSRAFGEGAGS